MVMTRIFHFESRPEAGYQACPHRVSPPCNPQPSALSMPYCVAAATCLLMWAFRAKPTTTPRALWVVALGYSLIHLWIIYLYQLPFVQVSVQPTSLAVRALGLFRIVLSGGPDRVCPPYNPSYVLLAIVAFIWCRGFWAVGRLFPNTSTPIALGLMFVRNAHGS